MKLRIHSDLHLEFEDDGPLSTYTTIPRLEGDKDTVLVLAGDIMCHYRRMRKQPHLDRYTPWMLDCINRFKHVVYVLGNHDYWFGGHYEDVIDYWSGMSSRFSNFHFLQNESTIIDGVRFLGTTLWTDLSNPVVAMGASAMNDFNYIKVRRPGGQWGKWSLHEWNQEHQMAVHFLEEEIFNKEWDGKTVVVTHHSPSVYSISDRFAGRDINCCYYTNLERFMWYGNIALWCHGHVHNKVDCVIGDEIQSTRLFCNPRGYVDEDVNPEYNPTPLVEI